MEQNHRKTAYFLIGSGLYLAIGYAAGFVTAGALLLAALGFSIVRAASEDENRDKTGYVLLVIAGLVLLVNHWGFLIAMILIGLGWFMIRSHSGNQSFLSFVKYNIVASIRWGKDGTWAVRTTDLPVAIAEIQIDLTKAFFEEADTTLNLHGFIADIDVVVPEDVGLSVLANAAIGKIDVAGEHTEGIPNRVQWRSPNFETATHKVHLHISYMIADIDVKVL